MKTKIANNRILGHFFGLQQTAKQMLEERFVAFHEAIFLENYEIFLQKEDLKYFDA